VRGIDARLGVAAIDGSPVKAHVALEREVNDLLARYDREAVDPIDALIADCAAETVRLRVRRLRAEKVLDTSFEPPDANGKLGEHRRWLLLERKRLLAEQARLEAVMGSLRMHRDRIAAPRSSAT
jgi:hypothetical protein